MEAEVLLSGWTRSRKVVLKWRLPDALPRTREALQEKQLESPFTKVVEGKQRWQYSVLVTSQKWKPRSCTGIERMRRLPSTS